MRWKKHGLVYGPDGTHAWARSHAMVPTPVRLDQQTIRVYTTFCDAGGIGRTGYVDVAASAPWQVRAVSAQPVLDIGEPGTFDENGVLACSVVRMPDGALHMYYAGFELGTKIRYRLLTGLAISTDGGTRFERASTVPVLERSAAELYIRGGPWALAEPDRVRMWYVGGSSWIDIGGKPMPVYDIRYLEAADGRSFGPVGQVQLAVSKADEFGFGRPCVIARPGGGYRLFYSVRRRSCNAYRLGYAESDDGIGWRRLDEELNLDVSPGSFDSDAIMYATPIEVDGRLYVFYNGNEFGRAGFALAELEDA